MMKSITKAKLVSVFLFFMFCFNVFGEDVNRIYLVQLSYDGGNIYLRSVGVHKGFAMDKASEGGYRCDIISSEGVVIDSYRFDVPMKRYYDEFDPEAGEIRGGVEFLDSVNFTVEVPYFRDAERMDFYGPEDRFLLSVDLSKFMEEDASTTKTDKTTFPNSKPASTTDLIPYAVFAALIVLLSAAMIYRIYSRHRK